MDIHLFLSHSDSPDYQRKTGKPLLLSTEDSGGRKDTIQAFPPTKANPRKQSSSLVSAQKGELLLWECRLVAQAGLAQECLDRMP